MNNGMNGMQSDSESENISYRRQQNLCPTVVLLFTNKEGFAY